MMNRATAELLRTLTTSQRNALRLALLSDCRNLQLRLGIYNESECASKLVRLDDQK